MKSTKVITTKQQKKSSRKKTKETPINELVGATAINPNHTNHHVDEWKPKRKSKGADEEL